MFQFGVWWIGSEGAISSVCVTISNTNTTPTTTTKTSCVCVIDRIRHLRNCDTFKT